MLSSSQLYNLGYASRLTESFVNDEEWKRENFTTVCMKFDIDKSTSKSKKKLEEMNDLIDDICKFGNFCNRENENENLEGLLSLEMGVDMKENVVHYNAIYRSANALDSSFMELYNQYIMLLCYMELKELICIAAPGDIGQCRWSLSKFVVPDKFLVIPSSVIDDHIKYSYFDKRKLYDSESIMFHSGNFKVKQHVIDDDVRWNALNEALQTYNQALLNNGDDILFIQNSLNRELGELVFMEQYGSREGIIKRTGYVAMQAEALLANLIPWEVNVFCSSKNKEFNMNLLQKHDFQKTSLIEFLEK